MAPVKLYIYDLSNGLAKQLSAQLTGRQIDGIWHTSIVVEFTPGHAQEVFYGQGINTTLPGRSHHGQPLQIVDLGDTAIDEETWQEYLEEMRDHYTADKYHLLDFNCNSFTNDCAGFLTGGSIPDFVKDLPTDFLSTPFGAALRPTIDNMYRRPAPGASAAPPPPNQPIAASLLQAVAAQAQRSSSALNPVPLAATESLAAPMHPSTNSASFRTLLRSHRAVVAFFTDQQGCPPCRVIAPVFEQLAAEKGIRAGSGGRGAAFTKIDLRVGAGGTLASEWGVRATPTFMFFLDGTKVSELKGVDPGELRTQTDLLLFQAYPPHPHVSLSLPAVKALSLAPILFTQVPVLDTVFAKLASSIDVAPSSPTTMQAKEVLRGQVVPYLKARFPPTADGAKPSSPPSATAALLVPWAAATATLVGALAPDALFPLVDMWRLAVLDPAAVTWLAAVPGAGPVRALVRIARDALAQPTQDKGTRNYVLTTLRLLANAFGAAALARGLLSGPGSDGEVLGTLVPALLHTDGAVRTAAASLAFNAAASVQRARVAGGGGLGGVALGAANSASDADAAAAADEEWQVELASALVEALERETGEEVVHRLVAALACLLRYAPPDGQVGPLVEVLGARAVVLGKLGIASVQKKEVRKLLEEVGSMCPPA
ncbi:PPPDE putative peptidase domain-containing protein [Mycena belliarum]|uniref:PPPDE putative peptidase domain-containing protein n=1 Tax=Mycena belliarum TaxID=1033014 RepID=A0AAD6TQ27_9AGAR|nr:PPPDE putative peptidase domain-containing protein [Mycena belliae]